MSLTSLIKKDGLFNIMTMTAATFKPEQIVTVAEVATVTVAEVPKTLLEMELDEETEIRAWLTHIKEKKSSVINDVLSQCQNDFSVRQYYLNRSKEVPKVTKTFMLTTCGLCCYFEYIKPPFRHPNLGHCNKGEPEAASGIWNTDPRHCERYTIK